MFVTAILEQFMVLLEGVLKIIFEKLNPIWMERMWRGTSEAPSGI
jgi:hypothetical protein